MQCQDLQLVDAYLEKDSDLTTILANGGLFQINVLWVIIKLLKCVTEITLK